MVTLGRVALPLVELQQIHGAVAAAAAVTMLALEVVEVTTPAGCKSFGLSLNNFSEAMLLLLSQSRFIMLTSVQL